MRPYLAILRDSLREALSSRTLPVLLVLFTVVLAALAPIGLEESASWRLTFSEIADQTLLVAKLRQAADTEEESPARRVWNRLPEHLQQQLSPDDEPEGEQVRPGMANQLMGVVSAINSHVLPDRKFYDAAAWENVNLSGEAENLLEGEPDDLSEEEVKRLNRVLLTAAFPGALHRPDETQIAITYLGYEISGSFAAMMSNPEIVRRVVRQMLYAVCVWGIGPIGLLISIIVTADIMPRTFEPGSIDLLLSKPVNRSLVFLTKFFGACAFVLISFGYLVGGLWLIFGFRLGEWSGQLWGVVPLFMFSFALIYAISAVVGLRYRSPIVAVFAAVFVWGAAFLLGMTNDVIGSFRELQRVERITPLAETVLVSTPARIAYLWNETARDWQERPGFWGETAARPNSQAFMLPGDVLGPVYDPGQDRIIAAATGPGAPSTLLVGTPESGWDTQPGAPLPPGTQDLFITRDGRLFAAGLAGLFEFQGDPSVAKKEFKVFGLYDLIPENAENSFVRADDEGGLWGQGMDVALDKNGQRAAVYRQGRVTLLTREGDDGKFTETASRHVIEPETEEDEPTSALIALAGDVIVLAAESGRVRLLEATTLKQHKSFQPTDGDPPKSVVTNPAGTIVAVLFHNGEVWLYDVAGGKVIEESPAGEGNISAIAFDATGRFWAADKLRRVRSYELPEMTLVAEREGELETLERIYRYGLIPLSYLLPDTYGMRGAYEYLFTDEQYEVQSPDARGLEERRRRLDVRGPLIQNALFLTVVLALACLYVSRKDF